MWKNLKRLSAWLVAAILLTCVCAGCRQVASVAHAVSVTAYSSPTGSQ